MGAGRITVLDAEGAPVRTVRPEARPGASLAAPVGRLAAEEWIFTSGGMFSGAAGAGAATERPPVGYYRARPDGSFMDSLVTLGGREVFVRQQGGRMTVWFVPFGKGERVAVGAGRVAWGETDRPEWWLLGPGEERRLVRLAAPRELVSDGDWSRAVEERVPDDAEPDARRGVRDAYAAMTRPAAWPFFDDLHIDPTGHLWVQRFRAPWAEGGTRTWWVFAPDGRHLGAVVFPGALDVRQITENAVVGVVTDELGVERVQAHRLRRP
jgi:hypothetical protein